MDLIVDEVGEIVVNSVHVGAGANASRRGAPLEGAAARGRGRQGQPRQARLPDRRRDDGRGNPPIIRLRIEVDGEVVVDLDEPVLMVAVGNGSSVGGGAELTPEADPDDGRST